ncbi:microsomal glutathione S-transferase 1-like isoform X2 [Odontomachus brunneus]|uniref:microsomal glutathione S-transferase 1-like isoform X1 n=1 Tax=Odontomachus brunneus TaxID=486640 RepID=UPI0013F2A4D7|nr:microsomal glutathione S-transferase 1-like isoform X1 [Odontomachus brunneus]XP_032664044.1 microsomal glutathione S-transferase 1-like isoform X2 [Odontomachus brunneus]
MTDINPEILKVFGFWGSILVLKLLAMVPLTVRQRYRKQVFANAVDFAPSSKAKVAFDDPDVERVRRSHLNDLENVVPWFIMTYIWLSTGPSILLAKVLIRTFVLSRIIHTLSYAVMSQQPTRGIAFFVGYGIICFEAIASLLHYL